jgi:hypothetical protein
VLRAQELLETTELNIDEVAREAGFGHSVLLRLSAASWRRWASGGGSPGPLPWRSPRGCAMAR